jgi:hypothetical protein
MKKDEAGGLTKRHGETGNAHILLLVSKPEGKRPFWVINCSENGPVANSQWKCPQGFETGVLPIALFFETESQIFSYTTFKWTHSYVKTAGG